MKKLIVTLLLFYSILVHGYSQSPEELPQNSIHLAAGLSEHGTDFVNGFAMTVEYHHYFRERLSWSGGVGFTLHDGSTRVIFVDNNVARNGAVRFTTGAVQTWFRLGYSFIRTSRHNLQVELGPLLRYQSTSNPEIIGLLLNPDIYFTAPLPARSLAFGGIGSISYSYTFQNNFFLRLQACLQYDTNQDALNMFGLGIGKRFTKFE